jgi:hypothetical protein
MSWRVVVVVREIHRMGSTLSYTLAAAAVIVILQWLFMTLADDWRWQLGALALPALFAGKSVARLLVDHDVVSVRRGGGRS